MAESSDDVVELETADPAAIARKRSFQKTAITKSENVSKRTRVAHGQSTEVAIGAETRVREFPDEPLKSDCGKLVCLACHTTLSGKKSIIMSNIATARHKQGKSRFERETQRQKLVKESFLAYQKRLGKALSGTGTTDAVSSAESLRRIQIVRSMLQAGIPLPKVDYLRPLLESDRNEYLY